MAASATDILLPAGQADSDQTIANGVTPGEASRWLRRPDVLATPGMLLITLGMCWYWNLQPNWNPQRFVSTQFLLVTAVAIPTYVIYLLVRRVKGKSLRAEGSALDLWGFLADMALFTVMTWIYAHVKAGLLLTPSCDELLAGWDRWLFAGHEPWVVCRQILPAWTASWMHIVYMAFYPVLLGVLFGLTLAGRRTDAARLCCALVLGYYVCALGYHVLPSYGPAYSYASAGTASLSPATHHTQQLLLEHVEEVQRNAATAAIQPWMYIAAFPSLHVSHVLILAWYVRRQRVALVLAAVFALATALSTVYLGWHYVCDWVGALAVAAIAITLTHTLGRASKPGS